MRAGAESDGDASAWPRRWGLAVVLLATTLYYALYFLSSRQVGMSDPDRYYHLGIASLTAEHGLLRALPQVEDLGWAGYFPDKEFLFHVLTGLAQRAGGYEAVLWLVPLIGGAIIASLYLQVSRMLPPWRAALLVTVGVFCSSMLVFRLSLLRPHLLAILFFLLLVMAILRRRQWLVFVACAGFALSYHAFYMVMLLVAVATLFDWPGLSRGRLIALAGAGLAVGMVLNPYFPSNIVMGAIGLQIALGIDNPPGLLVVPELVPLSLAEQALFYGLVPLSLLTAGAIAWRKRLRPAGQHAPLWFLLMLTLLLAAMGFKSPRAMEYAATVSILLAGCALREVRSAWGVVGYCAVIVALQFSTAWEFYRGAWTESQAGNTNWYYVAANALPPQAAGRKVFTCEWDAGSYLLYWRPDVRFVDLLDPTLLWHASKEKYLVRRALAAGQYRNPTEVLRQVFKADYVMCANPGLVRQMDADPGRFQSLLPAGPAGPLRLFRLVPSP